MTMKKCKEVLQALWRYKDCGYSENEIRESLDMAIKALEKEPCEDAVSREYILDKIHSENDMDKIENSNLFAVHYANLVKNAPSVTPAHKKCRNVNTDYAECDQFVCSNCGIELQDWSRVERDKDDGDITYHEYEFNFCPNCGARKENEEMSKIIESVDDVKLLINKYEWLIEQSERMIDDKWFDEVERVEWYDNDLYIYYSTYCCGDIEHLTKTVPIEWLFLSDDELKKEKKKKKEAEEEARQKQKKLNEILRKQAEEQKEREEYERLKAKYESKR